MVIIMEHKSTGMIRPVDELGRIVLPIELRNTLDINIRDGLEIYTDENKILLKKHVVGCIFCGEMKNTEIFKDKEICSKCKENLFNIDDSNIK